MQVAFPVKIEESYSQEVSCLLGRKELMKAQQISRLANSKLLFFGLRQKGFSYLMLANPGLFENLVLISHSMFLRRSDKQLWFGGMA